MASGNRTPLACLLFPLEQELFWKLWWKLLEEYATGDGQENRR
jgi:hypothetical protein